MTTKTERPSRLRLVFRRIMTEICLWNPRRRNAFKNTSFAALGQIESLEVRALLTTVLIDYSLDTNNFFDTQAKKDLLQTVADSLAGPLSDRLLAITPGPSGSGFDNTWEATFNHPGTGADHVIVDRTIPADTIIIFAGGRDLPGSTLGEGGPGGFATSGTTAFNETVAARGQAGALLANATDFSLWGGAVTFDTANDWHFGVTTAGLDSNESDFFTIAQHEIGHLLGIGTAKSWDRQISGGSFVGAASVASFGGNVPVFNDASHWATDTTSNGQLATMNASLLEGTRALFTDLDFAALRDIGWEVARQVTQPGNGSIDSAKSVKIASGTNSGPTLANRDYFGTSVTALGDVDGDGVIDLAVGAMGDDKGGTARGAVHVLFMNSNGTVKGRAKIADNLGGFRNLAEDGRFGSSVASLGDVNGDGVPDLAVGAMRNPGTVLGGPPGGVHVLMLNSSGEVRGNNLITQGIGGSPQLDEFDFFGSSLASVGDLDGDGVTDLAVGAYGDDTGGADRGAVYILLLNANGSAKGSVKLASGLNGGPTLANKDLFGSSVASLGDLDGDGVTDLAVGAEGDDTGGNYRGAVHILLLNADGTVKSSRKIASGTNGGPTLSNLDYFGSSVATLGDLDGDGVQDLAVGAAFDDTKGTARGAVHVLLLNGDGTVKSSLKVADGLNGGPTLANNDAFGSSLAALGDLNGDGLADWAVGALGDDQGGTDRGSVHVLFSKTLSGPAGGNTAPTDISLSSTSIPEGNSTNATVGTLTATDLDPANTFTFSLIAGSGDSDNSSFSIVGNTLRITPATDFETKNSFSIRVQATDQGGLSFDKQFNISIGDVDETAPAIVLNPLPLTYKLSARKVVAIDASATFENAITPGLNFTNAVLTVSGTALKDTLSIIKLGQIKLKGKSILFGKTVIGTFSGGTRGKPLSVILKSGATQESVQALLRNLGFKSTDKLAVNRTLQIQITKIGGTDTNPATRLVQFT